MQPKSNLEWQKWAKEDPLYGIATLPGRDRSGSKPWTLPEFYAFGALQWSEYAMQWHQYGLDSDSCLEIGCGAGRITSQLVQCFKSVYAIDVSPEMLELARANVVEAEFLLVDGAAIPLGDNSVSSVFSCEVFQHFDNRGIAFSYFREILRVLRKGGTCMVQLPIVVLPLRRILPIMGTVQEILWHATEKWVRAKSNIKRWLISHSNRKPFIYLIQYDPEWLLSELSEAGFSDIEIRLFAVTAGPGEKNLTHVLFARKA